MIVVIAEKMPNINDVYDFIVMSYMAHKIMVISIIYLNFMISFVSINQRYIIELINGRIPIKPKLLNDMDKAIVIIVIIIFTTIFNLS